VTRWRVVSKHVEKVDSMSNRLVLVVERDGRQREAVVSGATYDSKNVGDEVDLNLEESARWKTA
jgi:hypothetical protein